MHRLARKHKKRENIENIEFAVIWKQTKQENIGIQMFFVFWNDEKQENIVRIKTVVVLEH